MLDQKILNWIEGSLGPISIDEITVLKMVREHFIKHRTVELNKSLFNHIHGKQKQKLLGITYTPAVIREELTKVVLNKLLLSKNIDELKISDPCCGSGLFSITLLKQLIERGVSPNHALTKNIFFSDIDRLSVCISLINIYTYLEFIKVDPTKSIPNAKIIDHFDSADLFDGYITNPPYVKLQNLSEHERNKLRQMYPELFFGSIGLSSLILKRMFDTLKDNGVLGVITQNNFFTSTSGKYLRKSFEPHVFKIDTFGSNAQFEDVSAYTCLIYLTKKACDDFQYKKILKSSDFQSAASLISNTSLHHTKWRLGTSDELSDIRKLESIGVPLGVACRIWVGIATQFDKAFTVYRESESWVSYGPNQVKTIVESGIVRPLIRVSDLTSIDSVRESMRGIIYPYQINGNKTKVINEDSLQLNYPNTYKALSYWKKELLARQKNSINEEDWYKWGRIQSMIPVKNKLLTKTFSSGPCFYIDKTNSLFSNGYAISPKKTNYNLNFLQRVLNSQTFAYYAKLTSFEIGGDYQCYQKNFIERFCLPDISNDQQLELTNSKTSIDTFLIKYYGLSNRVNNF